MFSPRSSSRLVAIAALFASTAVLSGCPEEETNLFSEGGVWSLERYSLDGGLFSEISQNRTNRFLLRFKPDDGVVAAAACREEGTDVDVNSSNCYAGLSSWACQCFAYTFKNDRMVWQEFEPGEMPPAVGVPEGDGGTGDAGTEGGASAGGAHELFVAGVEDTKGAYEFHALPAGLFNSDGTLSKHEFQLKADSVWTDADIEEDGVADLEACSMSCFPSEAGG